MFKQQGHVLAFDSFAAYLLDDKLWRDSVDRLHTQGVLGRQGSNNRRAIAPVGGNGLEIGLDAGTTARIAPY